MSKCEHVEETNRHDRYYWLPDGTELGYLCESCVIEYGFCGICGKHSEDGFEDGVCQTCYQEAIGKDDQPAPTDDLARLQAENVRLRDALAWYADEANYVDAYPGAFVYEEKVVVTDKGDIARKALGGE